MDKMRLQTVKGFKDYLPAEALKRKFVVEKIVEVFQKFGFDPLETPTLEYADTLKGQGKYGEEEKLIYQFKTPGGDEVALKYDQTVPLARVVAQYGASGTQVLPLPFKRYQIQPAYRGENPQKGRYREFLQCDADIIGISTPLADAETLGLVWEIYQSLGLDVLIKINDRTLFTGIEPKFLSAIDKLNKVGEEGVLAELERKGLGTKEAAVLLDRVKNLQPTDNLKQVISLYQGMGYPQDALFFDPTLVRGLDYYTGLILESVLKATPISSSLGGGGRWDEMIGKFTGINLPAVGYSVGLDRTIEAMEEAGVLQITPTQTKILVTIFSEELAKQSLEVCSQLRSRSINAEVWLDPAVKLEKQLKYADQKGIPFALIIGPEEAAENKVILKDLENRTQELLSLDEVITRINL